MLHQNKISIRIAAAFLVALVLTPVAKAQVFPAADTVPALTIHLRPAQMGNYLTVFYVRANPPPITTNSSQYTVSEIKRAVTLPIDSLTLQAPAVTVECVGIHTGVNFVILVVHRGPIFTWVNGSDQSVPADPRGLQPDLAASNPIATMVLKKFTLRTTAEVQGHPELADVSF